MPLELVVQEESKATTDKQVMLAIQELMVLVDLEGHAGTQEIQEQLVILETQETTAVVAVLATKVTVVAVEPMVVAVVQQDQAEPEAVILELVVTVDPVQGVEQVVLEVEDKLELPEHLEQPELVEPLDRQALVRILDSPDLVEPMGQMELQELLELRELERSLE